MCAQEVGVEVRNEAPRQVHSEPRNVDMGASEIASPNVTSRVLTCCESPAEVDSPIDLSTAAPRCGAVAKLSMPVVDFTALNSEYV